MSKPRSGEDYDEVHFRASVALKNAMESLARKRCSSTGGYIPVGYLWQEGARLLLKKEGISFGGQPEPIPPHPIGAAKPNRRRKAAA